MSDGLPYIFMKNARHQKAGMVLLLANEQDYQGQTCDGAQLVESNKFPRSLLQKDFKGAVQVFVLHNPDAVLKSDLDWITLQDAQDMGLQTFKRGKEGELRTFLSRHLGFNVPELKISE